MKVIEAMENALTFLEALGYKSGGDIHDDLASALDAIKKGHRGYSRLREREGIEGYDIPGRKVNQ